MNTILQELTTVVSKAFEACGYTAELGQVTVSNRPDLCQFQCNGAFAGAKQYKKAPLLVAEEVAAVLKQSPLFQTIEVAKPGFLNLTLTDAFLLERAAAIGDDAHLGIPQAEHPETIVLDYGGPNVAKPLHIGHLRSAIIGEALKRLARAAGHTVISDIHLGDWGLQMGLVIAELEERRPEWPCFSPAFDPARDAVPALSVEELSELYPFASQKSKADEAFKERARQITAALQGGRPGYLAVWKELLRVSVEDLKKNYARLNVSFDYWYGESNAEPYVEPLLDRLRERGLLYESDGAQVVDVSEPDDKATVPPVLIKKSDHSNIYATTDLATILQREHDFHPDRIWYVVDKRQGLHFTQVFRCAKKAGLVPSSTELSHLGFGTMNGADGKPYKTRDGGVMQLSAFLSAVIDAAAGKLADSAYLPPEQREQTAQKVGIAAVKFGDLINHPSKDYIFDLDKFLSFEGKTGVYLLYTVTRIQSIFEKAGLSADAALTFHGVYSRAERDLLLTILRSGDAFLQALAERSPNLVCENAYALASAFSGFYHDSQILYEPDADKKASWLSLCVLTRRLLLKHLEILGIEPVERM